MGLQQIEFTDKSGTTSMYSTWDDDETAEFAAVLATLPVAFRCQMGGPVTWAGWRRALEVCSQVESEKASDPLPVRFQEALRRVLADGTVVSDGAAGLAGLMVAFDCDYNRPYPDEPDDHKAEHGSFDGASVTVKVATADFGYGIETLLTIIPAACYETYFNWPDQDRDGNELPERWYGAADLYLERTRRALEPFGEELIAVEQEKGRTPVLNARFDAFAVALAYAIVLGMPLPLRVPLHGHLTSRGPWTPDSTQVPPVAGEGAGLVVRFVRPPNHGREPAVVTMRRKGGPGDIPQALATIAGLPLLPLAYEASDDRVTNKFHATAQYCEKEEFPRRGWSGLDNALPVGDMAVRFRRAERYGLSLPPNRHGVAQGYASYLFVAEPGLWSLYHDAAERPVECDIEVRLVSHLPGNMAGDWVIHSSSDPDPTADSPAFTHVVTELRISPSAKHRDYLIQDGRFAKGIENLKAWQEVFKPFNAPTYRFDENTGTIACMFDLTFLASAYARAAGLKLPGETPFGPLPKLDPYNWEEQHEERTPYGRFDDDSLLTEKEVEEKREFLAQEAASKEANAGRDPFEWIDKIFDVDVLPGDPKFEPLLATDPINLLAAASEPEKNQ